MTSPSSGSASNRSGDLKSLSRDELRAVLSDLGEPGYRADQLMKWIYALGISEYSEMTNLPAALRDELEGRWSLSVPTPAAKQTSKIDGTRKYLWRFPDGAAVESVGLPSGNRLTVCFSTQVGCAMGCAFCATGLGGFVRNLTPGEIVDQVRMVGDDFGTRVTNAVAMGQGEPFANYDNVIEALRILNASDGLGIGARHIAVSTCGLTTGIARFSEIPEQFTLAVSLHSAIQKTRDALMPGVAGISIHELRESISSYGEATGRRPSLEYALIAGVNDSEDELEALIAFARGMLAHVNLIPANRVAGTGFLRASADRSTHFKERLESAGIQSTIRQERGADIDAACGQLRQRSS